MQQWIVNSIFRFFISLDFYDVQHVPFLRGGDHFSAQLYLLLFGRDRDSADDFLSGSDMANPGEEEKACRTRMAILWL